MNVKGNVKNGREGRLGGKRRATGWTLLALGVLVAGVWVWSGWYTFTAATPGTPISPGLRTEHRIVELVSGVLLVHRFEYADRHGDGDLVKSGTSVRGEGRRATFRFWFGWELGPSKGTASLVQAGVVSLHTGHSSGDTYQLMLWPIPLLVWTPAALLLRSGILARRRAMSKACPKCGYSLAELAADAPCPECGKGAGTK